MLYLGGLSGLFALGLLVFALADLATTDESECRHLPKVMWLLLILLLPFAGPLVWLAVGRPVRSGAARHGGAYERHQPTYPEYDRPGRFAAADPGADEEFLRNCRERAEEQRRRAREQRGDA